MDPIFANPSTITEAMAKAYFEDRFRFLPVSVQERTRTDHRYFTNLAVQIVLDFWRMQHAAIAQVRQEG
ncbi:MAG: hypothetical protein FJZ01_26835 [Candidatus Sericytochromatia bacterium]|nr:hypothetical protein [Candidatus Tanganyikabacteria bacterium]